MKILIIKVLNEGLPGNNKVLPVNFSNEHKTMIAHLVALFEDRKVAGPEKFDKLIVALKTAVVSRIHFR